VLARLLVDKTQEGEGPVDFRALSVREFGTIYEGLLDSRLAVAQEDLAVRKLRGKDEQVYVPATGDESVRVEAGAVYLHNRLGVRKATGSYFTKPFAVEHLLDSALETALDGHIARLNRLWDADDVAGLSHSFFDFRCADIAMGSGHFLVAALDRIEARLSAWLALHPVPAVNDELLRLRNTALRSLGDLGVGADIETTSLIRRQVARHCVYGVDLNRVAVELARLAIWVHTFVPGLPLSFLDHNLVCGNSLTGVGSLDEVTAEFDPDADPDMPSLFRSQLEDLLARSESALLRLARTSDATKREIDEARAAHQEAQSEVVGARAMFDVVAAHRTGACQLPVNHDEDNIIEESKRPDVAEQVQRLNPVHFPAAFPEVFLRDRPGFDCVLGNPPWEKAKVERQQWWGRHQPGMRALSVGKMNAAINRLQESRPDLDRAYQSDMEQTKQVAALLRRTFDLGAGDTDLYQAFGWRFWHLLADGWHCRGGSTEASTYGSGIPEVAKSHTLRRHIQRSDGFTQHGGMGVRRYGTPIHDCSVLRRQRSRAYGEGSDERPVCEPLGIRQPDRSGRDRHGRVPFLVGSSRIPFSALGRGAGDFPKTEEAPAAR